MEDLENQVNFNDLISKYNFKSVCFSNQDIFDRSYWASTHSDQYQPFTHKCSNCESGTLIINYGPTNSDMVFTSEFSSEFSVSELERIGGLGMFCKLSSCASCNQLYYVGFAYIEPQNGREVLVLNNIIELVEK
ncbi:hypothetical protein [Aureibacter tunicatorum]|uniref:Uncharacterized protein n=1 Tax=Aureibacter tunicatorum TaxID=866807 RepID=A0AAE4BS44_9BACT|nr:hypothetical protein [Aureibacter tunicatorum]MDR6238498.1 hypothetical protein [Aureibacter tunicatorum]BDD05569.1 hypothetical protein AUTU_30520 [Aureibacter tunicatorum]